MIKVLLTLILFCCIYYVYMRFINKFIKDKRFIINHNSLDDAVLVEHIYDNYCSLKNGYYASMIEVKGFNYGGLNTKQSIEAQIKKIKNTFMDIDNLNNLDIKVIIRKNKTKNNLPVFKLDEINKSIFENINKQFSNSSTVKYLIYLTSNKLEELQSLNSIISDRLKEYNSHILSTKEILDELIYSVNGEYDNTYSNIDKTPFLVDKNINFSELYFDSNTGISKVFNHKTIKYFSSYFLSFKDNTINHSIFDELFIKDLSLELLFNMESLNSKTSKKVLVDKKKGVSATSEEEYSNAEKAIEDIETVGEDIADNQEILILTDIIIYVYAESAEELREKENILIAYCEQNTLQAKKAITMALWLYLSRLIGFSHHIIFKTRHYENPLYIKKIKKLVYGLNLTPTIISYLLKFKRFSTGLNRCVWGNLPVATFKTNLGSIFNFCFQTTENNNIGHTLLLGATGKGKTTLAEYLIYLSYFKYKNLRTYSLDSKNGMFIFTEFLGGKNISFNSKDVQINPFKIDLNDTYNRNFLSNFIRILSNVEDEDEYITGLINYTNTIPIEDRDVNILIEFGLPFYSKIFKFLSSFLMSDNANLINGTKNSLDELENIRHINFAMDELFDKSEKIVAPIIYLIDFMIKIQSMKTGSPFLFFIDEAKYMLSNKNVEEVLKNMTLQIRKIGGIIIFGFQEIGHITDKSLFKNNCATHIFFSPDSIADDTYSEYESLGVSRIAFDDLVKTTKEHRNNPYFALIKKSSIHENVVVDVNLSDIMGSYLKFFSSNSEDVLLVKKLIEEDSVNWRHNYLKESQLLDFQNKNDFDFKEVGNE